MREQLTLPPDPGAWPGTPGEYRAPADREAYGYPGAVTEIVSAIGDTRRLTLISGALLAVDLAGMAIVVSALLNRGHAVALGTAAGLLMPVVLSWLAAVLLVLLAEWPVAGGLGELRRATGARVDPSAPWSPLGVLPLAGPDLDWSHVVPLIAAATLQHARAHRALHWTVITTAAFFLWTMVSLAAAAVA